MSKQVIIRYYNFKKQKHFQTAIHFIIVGYVIVMIRYHIVSKRTSKHSLNVSHLCTWSHEELYPSWHSKCTATDCIWTCWFYWQPHPICYGTMTIFDYQKDSFISSSTVFPYYKVITMCLQIGPPNPTFLKSTDKSTWEAKDVADSVLSDKSALVIYWFSSCECHLQF